MPSHRPKPHHQQPNTMASSQPFGTRSYASGKLPDRSINANALPFSASSFSRHRSLAGAPGAPTAGDFADPKASQQAPGPSQAPPQPPMHSQPQQDTNPLNRLTEEQREEINEAVITPLSPSHPRQIANTCIHTLHPKRNKHMINEIIKINSSPSSTSTATATSTTTNSASPSVH